MKDGSAATDVRSPGSDPLRTGLGGSLGRRRVLPTPSCTTPRRVVSPDFRARGPVSVPKWSVRQQSTSLASPTSSLSGVPVEHGVTLLFRVPTPVHQPREIKSPSHPTLDPGLPPPATSPRYLGEDFHGESSRSRCPPWARGWPGWIGRYRNPRRPSRVLRETLGQMGLGVHGVDTLPKSLPLRPVHSPRPD